MDLTVERRVYFNLRVRLRSYGDHLRVPMEIYITPCGPEVLSKSGNPFDIFLHHTSPPLAGTFIVTFNPSYNSLISTSIASCPIVKYELRDGSDPSLPLLSMAQIAQTNMNDPSLGYLTIATDGVAFTQDVVLRGITYWNKQIDLEFNIKVCGEETFTVSGVKESLMFNAVTVADPSTLSDADRYLTLTEAQIKAYFGITTYDVCFKDFTLIAGKGTPDTPWSSTSLVDISGIQGSYAIKFDKTVSGNGNLFIKASTNGEIYEYQEIGFGQCKADCLA